MVGGPGLGEMHRQAEAERAETRKIRAQARREGEHGPLGEEAIKAYSLYKHLEVSLEQALSTAEELAKLPNFGTDWTDRLEHILDCCRQDRKANPCKRLIESSDA